jgi:hypothetical protein
MKLGMVEPLLATVNAIFQSEDQLQNNHRTACINDNGTESFHFEEIQ